MDRHEPQVGDPRDQQQVRLLHQRAAEWFAGDLVNRGPKSLETLRFIKGLGKRAVSVLGNHDLHLIAAAHGHPIKSDDHTLDAILNAPDRDELIDWLRQQPLLHHDAALGYTMIHAGLPPQWDLKLATQWREAIEGAIKVMFQGYQRSVRVAVS